MTESLQIKQQKTIRLTVLLLVAVVSLFFVAIVLKFVNEKPDVKAILEENNTLLFSSPRLLPTVALTRHDGTGFTTEQFKGAWNLINFGYTFCPDICPTNMMLLGQVARQLEEEQKPMPQVYMVTVDPARDTPDLLKGYISYFNPTFKALSGDESVIASLARQLNNLFSRAPGGDDDVYFVDHSDNMAILNPEGQFVGIFRPPHKLSDLTTVLTDLMAR